MKNKSALLYKQIVRQCVIIGAFLFSACESFLEVDPPRTDLIKSTVFSSDATATAAMMDIYYSMSRDGFASGNRRSVTYLSSMSSDEMKDFNTSLLSPDYSQFYNADLNPVNSTLESLWSSAYSSIYKANAIIEGLASSSAVSAETKQILEGEARFIRAFCHFYLLNLFGDVPLITTTDYERNIRAARVSADEVYNFITAELILCKEMLPSNYTPYQGARTRINRLACSAFLARVYLYREQWSLAETEATLVLAANDLFSLTTPETVFAKNSNEAIWQLETMNYPNDLLSFYISPGSLVFAALQETLVNEFNSGDLRRSNWVTNVTTGGQVYFYPSKYKSFVSGAEYSTVLRLGEQYLIRAEARANQNKISDALEDLNKLRERAGLDSYESVTDKSISELIAQERKFELFAEWGHRWLDLKRTETIDQVLSPMKSSWESTSALYPIPESQIRNSGIQQNQGY